MWGKRNKRLDISIIIVYICLHRKNLRFDNSKFINLILKSRLTKTNKKNIYISS